MAISPVSARDSSSILKLRAFLLGESRAGRAGPGPAAASGMVRGQVAARPDPAAATVQAASSGRSEALAPGMMAEAAAKPPIEAARRASALPGDILDRRSASDLLGRRGSVDAAWSASGAAANTRAAREPAPGELPEEKRVSAKEDSTKEASAKEASAKEADRPSERELLDRLAGLEAEKAGGRRKRASGQAARSAAVQQALAVLKARDGEVRAHEGAHIAAGGRYVTGGASYSYQKGPDGRQYAVGGEVGIDSAPVSGKPEETAAKMRIVRAAALAPAEPSGADHAVAAAASQAEAAAFAEIAARRREDAAAAYGAERDSSYQAAGRQEAGASPVVQGEESGMEVELWA